MLCARKKLNFLFLLITYGIAAEESSRTHVTVFVHGSHGTFPTFSCFSKRVARVDEAIFACPLGMHRVDDLEKKNHFWTMADLLNQEAPEQFPRENHYVFGWSGKLSYRVREHAAWGLYGELKKLMAEYEERDGELPFLTVMTHSHGGNVALNLALWYERDEEPSFQIDRVLMLACPVQIQTSWLVTNPFFRRIYSLHSHRDSLQIMDPQGLHHLSARFKRAWRTKNINALWHPKAKCSFLSSRHFGPHEKISQARVRWNQTRPWNKEDIEMFPEFRRPIEKLTRRFALPRDPMHIEFLIPSFLRAIPKILRGLDRGEYELLKGNKVDRFALI